MAYQDSHDAAAKSGWYRFCSGVIGDALDVWLAIGMASAQRKRILEEQGMKLHCFRILTGIALLAGALVSPMAVAQPEDKKVVPAAAKQTPLDQPIEWLQDAKRNYGVVKDYTCTLVTQERVKGKLLDPSYVTFKMKTEPFSVYMKWIGDGKFKGQEVVFVTGKNSNKMRVKSPLLPGNIWMNVDVNDKRVME